MFVVVFFAGLATGLVAGFLAGHQFVSESISGLKELKNAFEEKLKSIETEVEAIEATADARIKPAIHAVTNRIKGLL